MSARPANLPTAILVWLSSSTLYGLQTDRLYRSLLTETQYTQISQALRSIAEMVPREDFRIASVTTSFRPTYNGSIDPFSSLTSMPQNQQSHDALWHYFWIMWYYTSITLSHPDALLIRGVVETSLPGAIATAGHLARPKPKAQRDIYEDRDVFRLLNSIDQSLRRLIPADPVASSGGGGGAERDRSENPFTTLLGFKTSLAGWRLVRLTMNDTSKPSNFVLDTILRACAPSEPCSGSGIVAPEVKYLRSLVQAFKRRYIWSVGDWVERVLTEIAQESENLEAALDTVLRESMDGNSVL